MPIYHAMLICPSCDASTELQMPADACVFSFECPSCGMLLRPRYGDCCVFCSYGSEACPPKQIERGGSAG